MNCYIFRDYNSTTPAVFFDEEELNKFKKIYVDVFMDVTGGDIPKEHEDFCILDGVVNPDFEKWWNEEE